MPACYQICNREGKEEAIEFQSEQHLLSLDLTTPFKKNNKKLAQTFIFIYILV